LIPIKVGLSAPKCNFAVLFHLKTFMPHLSSDVTQARLTSPAAFPVAWRRCLLLLAALLAYGPTWAQQYTPEWQLALSTANTAAATSSVTATATDASGNVLLAGNFDNTVSFGTTTLTSYGGGSRDIFVAKWSPATKAFVWVMQVGSSSTDEVTALAVNGSSIYIGGLVPYSSSVAFGGISLAAGTTASPEGFVAKLTDAGSNASFNWAQRVGAASALATYAGITSLTVGSGNTLYLTGTVRGTAQFGTQSFTVPYGGLDGYVAKLTDAGSAPTFNWVQVLGSSGPDVTNALALDGTHLYITGAYTGTARLGAITLAPLAPAAGGSDIFVARLTDYGNTSQFDWAKGYGSSYSDSGAKLLAKGTTLYLASTCGTGTVKFDAQEVVLSGIRSTDVYLTKLTDTGTTCTAVWGTGGTGPYADAVRGLVRNGDDLYLTGSTNSQFFSFGSIAFYNYGNLSNTKDVYVAKVTDTGAAATVGWLQQAGSAYDDEGQGLALAGNALYVVGSQTPPAKFLPYTLTTASAISEATAFLAALSTTGPGPVLSSVTPGTGPIGTTVVLNGRYLENTTRVTLNGQPLAGYSVYPSGLGISFTITAGNTAGTLEVTTPTGTATLAFVFCVQYPATGTNVSRCGPGAVTLTAGGLPAGSTYAWYTQATGGTAISGVTGPTYTIANLRSTTTYYVALGTSQTIACAGPRTAITATINDVPATPTVTSSTTASGVTLTSSAPTGNQWYRNGVAIAGATAPAYTLSGSSAGDAYTVVVTSAAGCASGSSCAQFIAAGTGARRCGPGPVTLTAAGLPPTGSTYAWYTQATGGLPVSTTTTAGYTTPSLAASTTYYVAIYTGNGNTQFVCEGPRTAVVATINDVPATPTITSTTTASGVTLTSSAPSGNQWYFNGTAIAGATAPTYDLSGRGVNGSYTVVTTSAAGCASAPSASQLVTLAAGAPAWLAQVQVHPNPTTGRFTLDLPATAGRPAQVRIFNALGQPVHVQQATTGTLQLDLTRLARGVYAVQVQFENEPVVKRIVLH
jgi:hypothetical protein